MQHEFHLLSCGAIDFILSKLCRANEEGMNTTLQTHCSQLAAYSASEQTFKYELGRDTVHGQLAS